MMVKKGGLKEGVLLCLFLVLSCTPSGEPEVYFSPGGGGQKAILERIGKAEESIDVAMYAFTARELAQALVKAKERGVQVRVLLDGDFAANEYSKDVFLSKRGIEVRVDMSHLTHSGNFRGLMHHKFAVIDGQTVITGSYNWTASAQERNEENLLIFPQSQTLARLYSQQFRQLWNRGTAQEARVTEPGPPSSEVPLIRASDLKSLRANAGKLAKVRGTVHRVGHSKRSDTYFLNFGPGKSSFTGVIFKSAVKSFLDRKVDPKAYEGRRVELTGEVVDHPKYGLEIIIEDPEQVRLIGDQK